jgi:catechol 2,3-dioxygenase-like lactoylglutathione lyase family enzyme
MSYQTQGAILGIHHVTIEIPTNSEEAARAFYGSVLGLKEIEIPHDLQSHGGVWFRCGDQQLHIGPISADFQPQRRGHPAFVIDNLGRWQELLEKAGAKVEEAIQEPGWQRFYSRDPFGNRLEFRCPA